jgi:hypothetical protein
MAFGHCCRAQSLGFAAGYASAYLLLTGSAYVALSLLGRLPAAWGIEHVAIATLSVAFLAAWARRSLR